MGDLDDVADRTCENKVELQRWIVQGLLHEARLLYLVIGFDNILVTPPENRLEYMEGLVKLIDEAEKEFDIK